ncbi:hypothetical protein [Curtobacterium luteum]|uniref:hypothetical protein n=1 Tax=Curtobacterium luteum TaxID=33881 RepID=UPI0038117BE8
MTNDDRSNEDRPTDGQPRYGERAAPASTPQYGEQYGDRDGVPRYGEQAPQYGDGQPQYGQQQYGQPQYGQGEHDRRDDHAGAPVWNDGRHQQQYGAGPDHGAPAWQSPEPVRKKKTVGVVAFVLGLASLVIGVVGGYIIGAALASSDVIKDVVPTDGATPDQQQLQQQLLSDPNVASQFVVGAVIIGIAAILGLWALVQGIIAVVTKRGRGWGVFAIILAVVATIATFATYIGVAASAALNSVN